MTVESYTVLWLLATGIFAAKGHRLKAWGIEIFFLLPILLRAMGLA